jgi:hypothetical protein
MKRAFSRSRDGIYRTTVDVPVRLTRDEIATFEALQEKTGCATLQECLAGGHCHCRRGERMTVLWFALGVLVGAGILWAITDHVLFGEMRKRDRRGRK